MSKTTKGDEAESTEASTAIDINAVAKETIMHGTKAIHHPRASSPSINTGADEENIRDASPRISTSRERSSETDDETPIKIRILKFLEGLPETYTTIEDEDIHSSYSREGDESEDDDTSKVIGESQQLGD